jgi:hypothetical protein
MNEKRSRSDVVTLQMEKRQNQGVGKMEKRDPLRLETIQ